MNRLIALLALLLTFTGVAHAQEIVTDREGAAPLALPTDDPAFTFAVFGDRTGGPPEGVQVLEHAVGEVNQLGPDLVMTVGDLINGYNQTPEWLAEMDEFKGVMGKLDCPWFPVAGNHDIYWRGGKSPKNQHESNYERHFGPLWYAFEHKGSWFIVLYSDEGDPKTGRKSFSEADLQKMSTDQFDWLKSVLQKASNAEHVFLFIHHPRWTEKKYGTDWRRVHAELVRAGNVTAVFGGHIHYMRYDPKDGIEYFALATVGGYQDGIAAEAGFLDQYHVVTVRSAGIDVTAYPVGASLDPRKITGALATDVITLNDEVAPDWSKGLVLAADGSSSGMIDAELTNPTDRPLTIGSAIASEDYAWTFGVDHAHVTLQPRETRRVRITAERRAGADLSRLDAPYLNLALTYRGEQLDIPLPMRSFPVPLDVSALSALVDPASGGVLVLDGEDDCLAITHEELALPDGPLTLEGWIYGQEFRERQAIMTKTESAEFGIFANNGRPEFNVHLNGKYRTAESKDVILEPNRWYHIAGVFDGSAVRLYVDGELAAETPASGERTLRDVSLLIGADVRASGAGMSFFRGSIDEVRLSSVARYSGSSFVPPAQHTDDEHTVLYLPMSAPFGPYWLSSGVAAKLATQMGQPKVEPGSAKPETAAASR